MIKYWRKFLRYFATYLLLISLGCGGLLECDCANKMERTIKNRGAPEEITRYDSSDYHSHTYWYYSQGYSKTFTWGSIIEGCCETSEYRF